MLLPPLFEEANRLRRTLILAMRAMATLNVSSILPDLSGQNESLTPTEAASLSLWRAEAAAVAHVEGVTLVASFRGSALIDDAVEALHWRCAPLGGPALLKGLLRSRLASDAEAGVRSESAALLEAARTAPLTLGGNRLSPTMIGELTATDVTPLPQVRTVTVANEAAHGKIIGSPLWLRAEPDEDQDMAHAIAHDILNWMQACGAS